MIDGDPGAGKTTFIKRLCYIWAQTVLHPEERDTEDEYIHKYTLVIPIILRFVKEQNTIIDIFTSQLKCLSIFEICAVISRFESHPKNYLLLLDGYDEYTGHSRLISKVIMKEEYADILTFTTSRPHAVEQLKRHASQAVNKHIRLCGFSREQVKQYVSQFFLHHSLKIEDANELIEILFFDRKKLLEVAKTPIRSEMICTVWAVYGQLGETLADLYELFVIHLITHQKNKLVSGYRHEGEPTEVIDENKKLLLLVGQVANTWERYGRLRIVFNTEELKSVFNNQTSEGDSQNGTFNKVITIGLITKSHPSNILQESKWSFPHLTIQEYFVAFLLGNDTTDTHISRFVTRCKSYRSLRRCEVIFTFLCCKYPSAANKILTELLLEEKDEQKCQEVFDFICKVYPHYTKNTLDIPLPCYLKLEENMDVEMMNTLLESEKKQKQPNLRHLTIEDLDTYRKWLLEVPDIEECSVTVDCEICLKSIKIHRLSNLTIFSINSKECLRSTDHADFILKNISCDRLTDLSVTAPDALEAVSDTIHRFKVLQKLHVACTAHSYYHYYNIDRSSDKTHGYKILSVLKDNNNIKEVSLCVPDLDDRIIQEKFNMKVKLQVMMCTLSEGSLGKAVRDLDFTGGLCKLDLGRNNLKDEGESLGQLMGRMATLKVLDLCLCNIQADTVQAMVQTIKEIKVTSGLHTLYMGRCNDNNNLHTGGYYLGELVALIPDLYRLDLAGCNLIDADLVHMSDAVPATTSIHILNLQDNYLYDTSEGLATILSHTHHIHDDSSEGLVSLLSHTPNIQAFAVGGVDMPVPILGLCRAADAGSLNRLHVLDMSWSNLQPWNLKKLGQHLRYMSRLQVINLGWIDGEKPVDYQHVYSNLPPSIQHLNVWTPYIKLDVYLILDHQHHLNQLQTLNVRLSDSDIDLLQEVLEQNSNNIHVHNNKNEDTWRMYTKYKDQD